MATIETDTKNIGEIITYDEYGTGQEVLLAFHGYGMDGFQFQILSQSILPHFKVIGFHLPYHKHAPASHEQWLSKLLPAIGQILEAHQAKRISLMGYSIGAKVALQVFSHLAPQVNRLFLMAPFGLENHWGLTFVTKRIGNSLFRLLVNTSVPLLLMRIVTKAGIIDTELFDIIARELASAEKRKSLCSSLRMIGEIGLNKQQLITLMNRHNTQVRLYYGTDDALFPYKGRNQVLLGAIEKCEVTAVSAGHWMVTEKLDELIARQSS